MRVQYIRTEIDQLSHAIVIPLKIQITKSRVPLHVIESGNSKAYFPIRVNSQQKFEFLTFAI